MSALDRRERDVEQYEEALKSDKNLVKLLKSTGSDLTKKEFYSIVESKMAIAKDDIINLNAK